MAEKTKPELRTYADTYRNTNGVQSMTGATENVMWNDVIDSMALESEVGTPAPQTIIDVTENSFTNIDTWLGNLVRWTGTANGTLTLDDLGSSSVVGYNFSIYNNTDTFGLTVAISGPDTIKSHNNQLDIPANSYARIGVLSENAGSTEWYATIEQTPLRGEGELAKGLVGIQQAVTANVWTLLDNPTYVTGILNNVTATPNGGLRVAFPNNGVNTVNVGITIMASMAIPTTEQTLDLSFGVDDVVHSGSEINRQSAKTAATSTTDMFWPYTFVWEGKIANGSVINPFIRSDKSTNIQVLALTVIVKTASLTGVDLI